MAGRDVKIQTPFQLLIKPVAADCNMVCRYCFYQPKNALFGSGPHRMADGLLERIVKDYLGYGFDPAVFIWQGGEPTMAGLGFFEKVVELEQAYGRKGQKVGNAFQTNGLLIDEAWADFLRSYSFLLGVSLDGPPEVHDASRRTQGGKGTFNRVMRAANLLRRHGVAVNILAVVSRANVEKAREVYRFFRREGFTELQFIPCLECDPAGRIADFCPTPSQYGRFLCRLFDAWMEDGFPEVSLRTFESFIACAAGLRPGFCLFADQCGSYLLIEHNGDVYPCDFFVEPRWRIGNVSEAPISDSLHCRQAREFLRIKPHPDISCSRCRWWEFCHAGCPKDWKDSRGRPAERTYFCESYKMFLGYAERDLLRIGRGATGHKPGRNDPCPCGSGKKYKKCCLAKEKTVS